jgi:hypothetical protein
MAISNQPNSRKFIKPSIRKGLAKAIAFRAMLAGDSAVNIRRFCQSRDGKGPQRFLRFGLTLCKAFNRDSLWFSSPYSGLETALLRARARATGPLTMAAFARC